MAPSPRGPRWAGGSPDGASASLHIPRTAAPPDIAITAGLLRFGAFLRSSGLAASTGRMLDLLRAIEWLDLREPDEFFWASRCLLTERFEDLAAFDRAFMAFFQPASTPTSEAELSPQSLPRVLRTDSDQNSPAVPSPEDDVPDERRTGSSLISQRERREGSESGMGEGSGLLSWSADELLRAKDFGALSDEERRACRRLLARMEWRVARRRSRRLVRANKGKYVDWRRSYRRNIGYGGVLLELERQRNKIVRRPLVVIADVSGSMDRYTRPVLQLVHTMRAGHGRVEAFVFGTRLTRVTNHLRCRDADVALQNMAESVIDWAGGTRIGDSLKTFNRSWARRMLGRGSVVIIVSDGWDRGDPQKMTTAMRSLQRRCHRLIWLNPAMGGATVRPLPLGMKAAMPYIDDLMPARNLNDLYAVGILLESLAGTRPARRPSSPSMQGVR